MKNTLVAWKGREKQGRSISHKAHFIYQQVDPCFHPVLQPWVKALMPTGILLTLASETCKCLDVERMTGRRGDGWEEETGFTAITNSHWFNVELITPLACWAQPLACRVSEPVVISQTKAYCRVSKLDWAPNSQICWVLLKIGHQHGAMCKIGTMKQMRNGVLWKECMNSFTISIFEGFFSHLLNDWGDAVGKHHSWQHSQVGKGFGPQTFLQCQQAPFLPPEMLCTVSPFSFPQQLLFFHFTQIFLYYWAEDHLLWGYDRINTALHNAHIISVSSPQLMSIFH